jgi:hypothetical protein
VDLPLIHISSQFEGRLTELGLLNAQGTFQVSVSPKIFQIEGCFFQVAAEDFFFALGVRDNCIFFQRNDATLCISHEKAIPGLSDENMLVASWGAHGLTLMIGGLGATGFPIGEEVKANILPPPPSLIKWARLRSLIPVTTFDSENHFLSRVHSSLTSLEQKFLGMHSPSVFWDIAYEGNRIVSRRPKHEQDLHPIVAAVLSDQMMLSSIDVLPEVTLRSGRLDFLFLGAINNQGIGQCMVEFKNAHSTDLIHGLEHQLPEYMRAKGVAHGAYCVFDFRGEWFDLPLTSPSDMLIEMDLALRRACLPPKSTIKFYFYRLGKARASSRT